MRKEGLVLFKDGRAPFVVGGSRKTDEIFFDGQDLKVLDTDGFVHVFPNTLNPEQKGFIVDDNFTSVSEKVDVLVIVSDDYNNEFDLPNWVVAQLDANYSKDEAGYYEIDFFMFKNKD